MVLRVVVAALMIVLDLGVFVEVEVVVFVCFDIEVCLEGVATEFWFELLSFAASSSLVFDSPRLRVALLNFMVRSFNNF